MGKSNLILSKENRIFSLAKESRHLPNVFLAIMYILGIMFFADLIFFMTPLSRIGSNLSIQGLKGEALSFSINFLIIPFGLYIIAFFLWVKFIEKRPVYTMGLEKGNILKKYLRGFILGIIMISFCVLVFTILGLVTIDRLNPSIKGFNALGGVLILLVGWIVQGASEEIMIRGWLLPVVGMKHNVALGIFISSTLFGGLHLFNNNIGILPMVNLILFGVFAALYVIWEGSLWGICALHSSWNWVQGNILGFEVSGTPPRGGMLIDFQAIPGYDSITGGLFGIEGGLVCSSVLVLGILILIFMIKRR